MQELCTERITVLLGNLLLAFAFFSVSRIKYSRRLIPRWSTEFILLKFSFQVSTSLL
jgi:hypothetical protein